MADRSRTEHSGRPRAYLTALLLLALGVVLLLNTTGVIRPTIWLDLVRYWPVLLILLGTNMILGRRRPLICTAVVALILAGTVFVAYMDNRQRENDDLWVVSYSPPVSDTERLQLDIEIIGGVVFLMADHGGEERPRLLMADFNDSRASVVERRSGGLTRIDLAVEDLAVLTGAVQWDLAVSTDVAVSIDIDAGASDVALDLNRLDVERLDIGAAASNIRVWLPADAGTTDVVIGAGAVGIRLVVPERVAARIMVTDSVLSSVDIDTDRFPKIGEVHSSPDYYASENRVSIDVSGVGTGLTVR